MVAHALDMEAFLIIIFIFIIAPLFLLEWILKLDLEEALWHRDGAGAQ